jgi:hypothetical protein
MHLHAPTAPRHRRRLGCVTALVVLALVATACSIGPSDTNRMTGTWTSGAAASLRYDDNNFYTTGASCDGGFGCVTEWSAWFQVGEPIPESGQIGLLYSGKNDGAGFQSISVWNWNTMDWVAVDTFRFVATSEERVNVHLPGPNRLWAHNRRVGLVKVTTVGRLSSSSADQLNLYLQ